MRNLLILACFFAMAHTTQAQEYKAAVGARLGNPLSASIKYFTNENTALEAYVGTRGFGSYRWVSVSGAYLRHQPIDIVEGLQWYYGGGASVYFWTFDISNSASTTTIGLQGYIGLDYAFQNTPISITLDWIPTYFFNGFATGFGRDYGSLGVRYIFSR